MFNLIAEAISPLPLIANGDVLTQQCVQRGWDLLIPAGVSSLMIARGAQWNVSIFRISRSEPALPLSEVSQAYLRKACETGTPTSNAKYTLLQMWMGAQEMGNERGAKERVRDIQKSKTYEELCRIFSLDLDAFTRSPLDNELETLSDSE